MRTIELDWASSLLSLEQLLESYNLTLTAEMDGPNGFKMVRITGDYKQLDGFIIHEYDEDGVETYLID